MEAKKELVNTPPVAPTPPIAPPTPIAPPSILRGWGYAPRSGQFDEMVTADGELRPHWRGFMSSVAGIGRDEFVRRWQEGRRLIHDNGVTYYVYGDPRGMDRPWELDALPLVIASDEWSRIETAIQQRARLLNAVLADLYGPQQLLLRGLLPPELVFAHSRFLRPCHNVAIPGGTYLHVYAADLARSPDGSWWVIGDRTQAPSGSGYALENRLVLARMLPDVFRDCQVRRLAPFFQAYRQMLMGLAPSHRENPRIVLLTPGLYNETYFEHAYLARYLGYTLVEGGDLVVRDNRVFLKTLSRLLPVDVILRRQDDSYCDPLELRGDSTLGVPGLVQAIRSGNVAVANALGSGLIETPAMMAFMPQLAEHLLGESLHMRSVATWWCGDEASLGHTTANLDSLVIKPTFPAWGQEPIFGQKLGREAREQVVDRLRAAPYRYVAQEQVPLATAPVWTDAGLESRHLVLRVYAVASGDSYSVMPGGLVRVSATGETLVVSMQRGGGSKDTWVLADGPVAPFSLLRPPTHPIDVSRASFDLPSRVADNLFWLGRNAERVEWSVRLLRTALARLADERVPGGAPTLSSVMPILCGLKYLRADAAIEAGDRPAAGINDKVSERAPEGRAAHVEQELMQSIFDRKRRGGLRWNLSQLHSVAWLVRDRISTDTWRVLSRLDQEFASPPVREPLRISTAIDLLDRAIIYLSAFGGQVMESMTRGQGWRFLDIGRRLERAIQMEDLLRHALVAPEEDESDRLTALLEVADSSLTYRSRYLTSMQAALVIDLLLIDEANPKSIAFQMARLGEHIDQLPQRATQGRLPAESRLVLSMLRAAQLAQIEELIKRSADGRRHALEALLALFAAELPGLSDALTRAYLSHAVPARQLQAPFSELS